MQEYIYLLSGGQYKRVAVQDIKLIESELRYSRIITKQREYLPEIAISQLEEHLPMNAFCRVHRRYIVPLEHIDAFDRETVTLQDSRVVPIGATYRKEFLQRLTIL